MKNLLIYIGPTKEFSSQHLDLTKMQIDNSLELGWKLGDILLVTDFPWEYRGVKSYVVKEGNYDVFDQNRSSKVPVILQLFKDRMIDDLMWFHDHDAFQLEPFDPPKVEMAAFTDHGYKETWNAGSFFFNKKAKDLFVEIYDTMNKRKTTEQDALTWLWSQGAARDVLNITYNLGIYNLGYNMRKATKPYLVAHFHPHKLKHMDLFRPIIPDRLMAIFNKYGIR